MKFAYGACNATDNAQLSVVQDQKRKDGGANERFSNGGERNMECNYVQCIFICAYVHIPNLHTVAYNHETFMRNDV